LLECQSILKLSIISARVVIDLSTVSVKVVVANDALPSYFVDTLLSTRILLV
jgi:hypothetical protein